jgi:UDP-N-acetyl-D-mannosaminuronate dehydrogenase
MKIGILGYGEIGSSIEKIYKDFEGYEIKIKDLERNDGFEGIEILNICMPFDETLIEVVSKEIKKFKPRLTIIHSTIAPETTSKIKDLVPEECDIVHSPVRGVHPELRKGIKTFVKYIGGDTEEGRNEAKKHLENLGINVKVFDKSLTTELGKLLDTTYYGVAIAWHGEMKKLCDKYKVNFEEISTDFNKTYNEGYKKLGKENVIRPVLFPPENNKIGGHCIITNAKLLSKYFDSEALDLIFKYS